MQNKTKKHYEQASLLICEFNYAEILSASEPFASDNYDDGAWFAE